MNTPFGSYGRRNGNDSQSLSKMETNLRVWLAQSTVESLFSNIDPVTENLDPNYTDPQGV